MLNPDILDFLEQSNNIEGIFDVPSLEEAAKAWRYIVDKPKLSTKIILHTHKLLMVNQSMEQSSKGKYRGVSVWVGGRKGKPWETLFTEMDIWIKAVNNSLSSRYVKTYVHMKGTAIAMHISFEMIHPFLDGNGRIGRILLNWQLLKFGLPVLVIRAEKRAEYYRWFE